MELSFLVNGISYAASYVGDRPGKPGRWWRCDVLDLWIQPAVGTDNVAEVFATAAELLTEGID